MTPCKFTFDDSPEFDGFAYGTTWNGFDNVAITVETAKEIDTYFEGQAMIYGFEYDDPPIASATPDENGLICLAYGFATQIIRD